jgi:hypothetical protein
LTASENEKKSHLENGVQTCPKRNFDKRYFDKNSSKFDNLKNDCLKLDNKKINDRCKPEFKKS